MTNILNTRNINSDNIIPAKKLSSETKTGRCIEAPQSLPEYSIEKTLREKDEFRKEIIQQQNMQSNKKKKKIFPKLIVCIAAAAGYFLLKGKKTIK